MNSTKSSGRPPNGWRPNNAAEVLHAEVITILFEAARLAGSNHATPAAAAGSTDGAGAGALPADAWIGAVHDSAHAQE